MNEKLSDKWKECLIKASARVSKDDITFWIEEAERIYNQPAYNPLCEKIWTKALCNEFHKVNGKVFIGIKHLNEATKNIVEFPKITDIMVHDLNDGLNQHYSLTQTEVLESIRNNCAKGKYS